MAKTPKPTAPLQYGSSAYWTAVYGGTIGTYNPPVVDQARRQGEQAYAWAMAQAMRDAQRGGRR